MACLFKSTDSPTQTTCFFIIYLSVIQLVRTNQADIKLHPRLIMIVFSSLYMADICIAPWGGGVLHKKFGREAQHKLEKWTPSDLTWFKKRGSIGLEIGKRGSIVLNINTKGVNQIELGCLRGLRMLKRAPNRIENLKNEGHHCGTSLLCPSMGVPPPPGTQLTTFLYSNLVCKSYTKGIMPKSHCAESTAERR